jgi:hypothetical protein
MANKDEVRIKLANAHYASEPGITHVYSIWARPEHEARPNEPIKLLEVNQHTVASGILPLGFGPAPASGYPFPSVIVEVTPEEFRQILSKQLHLPNDWQLGDLIPPPRRE